VGFSIVGISKDPVESHRKFAEKLQLGYPLLADPEKTMLQALGAWGEKKLYGKVSMGAVRSTFVFNAEGKLIRVYPKVKAKGHAAGVLEDIRNQR
jgi:peroxiredoxin Q/BCP